MSDVIDYIIIGNGIAGTTAAEAVRAEDNAGSIKIFTDDKYPFYARIRLPQFLADEVPLEKLILKNDAWYKEKDIDLHLSEPVIDADPEKRTITTKNGDTFSFKKLLLAAGSHSYVPPFEGVDLEGVFTLRNISDAIRIKEYMKGKKEAVIIGGGLLGLEAGKALMCHGIKVAVVEYFDRLLPRQIDIAGANILKCTMEKLGYHFYLGLCTDKIVKDNGRLKVLMNDGNEISTDLILLSAGVRSNLTLAKKLGLTTNKGVIVNDHMQTSKPYIFAAGDICEHNGRSYGIWPAGKEQGMSAGTNMVELTSKYEGTTMMTALKVAGINLTSIGELDAESESPCIVEMDDKKGVYKKYVIKDNILVGCILLGDTKDQKKMGLAIKEKRHVDELKGMMPNPFFFNNLQRKLF
jgi:nitrite reductase (NADH) large subunit